MLQKYLTVTNCDIIIMNIELQKQTFERGEKFCDKETFVDWGKKIFWFTR